METTCGREQAGSSSVTTHKKRKMALPVYVVEDHNEALYYIYRGIGSKRLPFSGGTMIHFDSHPDLMLPKKLLPEKIKDRDHVLDSVSIENWILPTVFAGHITTVVWMKPFWSDQIAEGTYDFVIGHYKELDDIRMTCPEPYFVSEVMYAPSEDLDQAVDATLIVQTLECHCQLEQVHHVDSDSAPVSLSTKTSLTSDKNVPFSGSHSAAAPSHDSRRPQTANPDAPSSKGCTTETGDAVSEKLGLSESTGQKEIEGAGDVPISATCLVPLPTDIQEGVERQTPPSITSPPSWVTPIGNEKSKQPSSQSPFPFVHPSSPPEQTSSGHYILPPNVQQAVTAGQPYLLDIDLDFCSTKNPFLELYSETQLSILHQLYRFDLPSSTTQQDLKRATEQRRHQLNELEAMLRHVQEGGRLEEFPDSPRRHKVQELLNTFQNKPIDYQLLHDTGCTCDCEDTVLPHHVSTREEVLHLVGDMKRFLQAMPPPGMVTIARSSRDDYCPPEDVDFIQDCVLKMLEEVFGALDIKHDYGEDLEAT